MLVARNYTSAIDIRRLFKAPWRPRLGHDGASNGSSRQPKLNGVNLDVTWLCEEALPHHPSLGSGRVQSRAETHCDVRTVLRLQYFHDIPHVDFHRAFTHVHVVSYDFIRLALLDRANDCKFAVCNRGHRSGRWSCGDARVIQAVHRHIGPASQHKSYRLNCDCKFHRERDISLRSITNCG